MNKSNLKDGMVLEYRNGLKRIISDHLLNEHLQIVGSLNAYDDELMIYDRGLKNLDIMMIYPNLNVFTDDSTKPLWSREEIDWIKTKK